MKSQIFSKSKLRSWLGGSFVMFSMVLVLCLAFGANALEAAGDRFKALSPEELTDSGDYYLLGKDKKIGLLRTRGEVAVRYAGKLTSAQGLQRLQETQGVPTLQSVAYASLRSKGGIDILRSFEKDKTLDVKSIAASPTVAYAYPVLVDPVSKCRMVLTDEVLARLVDGVTLADVQNDIANAGLEVVERTGSHRMNVYLLRLVDPKKSDPLKASRELAASQNVLWAEPNFIREIQRSFIPDDPLFEKQQYLHSPGQNGAVNDADIDAPEAWDETLGSSSIVIAIIDDGVDTEHSDLSIYYNPGESGSGKETNGVDDDGNGKVDDYRGWDFADNDNNPNPVGNNGHGTACAGVAAAITNNGNGTAGIAGGCKVLPVKIIDDAGNFTSNQNIGDAISYAADFADILSNSWGGGSGSSYINDAIEDTYTNGRGGKGCPIFFATGNRASAWMWGGPRVRLSVGSDLGPGTYSFGFRYAKDGSVSSGEDLSKIDNVVLLDADGYTHINTPLGPSGRQDFEGAFPPTGWSSYSSHGSKWSITTSRVFTGTGGAISAESGPISNSQWTELRTPNVTLDGDEILAFVFYVSSETYFDNISVRVYDSVDAYQRTLWRFSGVAPLTTEISYPASHANTIAVGASTDCDLRSDYSQYGIRLDFLGPSNGGWSDIVTLDPTGSVGMTPTDYNWNFGGTSSATPLAAGTAALVLSRDPDLTASELRTLMRKNCDKIGGVIYSGGEDGAGGWNEYYGYGRLNASLVLRPAPSRILTDTDSVIIPEGGTATFQVKLSEQPSEDVTISVSRVSGDTDITVPSGESLTFNSSDWSDYKTAMLAAAEDADGINGRAVIRCNAEGWAIKDVAAIEDDDDRKDYFTQWFDTETFDLANQSIIFAPDGTTDFYGASRIPNISELPTGPADGDALSLSDDDQELVTLTDGVEVTLYGNSYDGFYVGSNGYITFGSADIELSESFRDHFGLPRISALFDDLVPDSGQVTWKQLSDRVVVTFENVREYGSSNSNTFQIEMFYDGKIVISYLGIAATDGLAGLSEGNGVPSDFFESDLSRYPEAGSPLAAPSDLTHSANTVDTVTWSWTDNSDNEEGFRGHGASHTEKWTATANGTNATETGLAPNTPYTRHVHAYNADGEGGPSNEASAYTSIEASSGVEFRAITETSIEARSANTPSNLAAGDSGLIIRNKTNGSDSGWMKDNNFWTSSSLPANTQHEFAAQTRNGDGDVTPESGVSSRWTLPVAPSVTCDRATGNPAHPANTELTFTNTAGWSGGGLDHYHYAWDQNQSHTFTGSESIWSNGTLQLTGTDLGLWYLHLMSHNGEDVSGGTADLGPYRVLNAPVLLVEPTYTPGTSNTIEWEPANGADEYWAECSDNSNFNAPKNSGWASVLSATFDGLTAGQQYWYRVKAAKVIAGVRIESGWSNIVSSTQTYMSTVTMAVRPAGGGSTTPAVGTHTYAAGIVVNVSASPNAGYRFDHWEGDLTGSANPTTLTMKDGDKNVTAVFVRQFTLTIAVSPTGGGSTTPAVGEHVYDSDTVVSISATANDDYELDHWSGDVSGTENRTTLTMDSNKSVTAHFRSVTEVSVRPSSVEFGCVPANDSVRRTVIIVNGSNDVLNAQIDPMGSPFSVSPTTASLDPGGYTTLTVTFAPTQEGDYDETLHITTDQGDREVPVSATCVSANPNLLAVGKERAVLGAQDGAGNPMEMVVPIYLKNDVDLTLLNLDVTYEANTLVAVGYRKAGRTLKDPEPGGIDSGVIRIRVFEFGNVVIPAGDGLILEVVFVQTDNTQVGAYPLNASNISASHGPATVEVYGQHGEISLEETCIRISPDNINFGCVAINERTKRGLVIVNECGENNLVVNDIEIAPSNSPFSVRPTNAVIEPGAAKVIDVVFAPTQAGDYDATLSIKTDQGDRDVSVSGSSVSASANLLSVGKVRALPDSQDPIVVPMYLRNAVGLTLFNFDLGFRASSFVAIEVRKAGRTIKDPETGGIDPGLARVRIFDFGNVVIPAGDGLILEVVFVQTENAEVGSYPLNAMNISAKQGPATVDICAQHGEIAIVEELPWPSPAELHFGSVETGVSAVSTISLVNEGEEPLDVEISSDNSAFLPSITCAHIPHEADPDDCNWRAVKIIFAPTQEGEVNGRLTIKKGTEDIEVPLTGIGVSSPSNLLCAGKATRLFDASERIVIGIGLRNGTDLSELSFKISYDTLALDAVDFRKAGRTLVDPVGDIDDGRGVVEIHISGPNGNTAIPADAMGKVLEIDFTFTNDVKVGSCPLTLSEVIGNNGTVSVELQHGEINAYKYAILDVDDNGECDVGTDIVYIYRTRFGLSPVPPEWRVIDPNIPPNEDIAARINKRKDWFDVDDSDCGDTDVGTDIVYIYRARFGLSPVPSDWRVIDPTIPADELIAANVNALCLDDDGCCSNSESAVSLASLASSSTMEANVGFLERNGNFLHIGGISADLGEGGIVVPISLKVDEDVTLLSVNIFYDTDRFDAVQLRVAGRTLKDPESDAVDDLSGIIRVRMFDFGNVVIPQGEGLILEAVFNAADNTPSGDYDLLFNNLVVKNGPKTLHFSLYADAGPDETVLEGDMVMLDGSRTHDPNGGALRYQWTQIEGPTVDLELPDAERASFFTPPVRGRTILRFELRVENTQGDFDTDEVTIVVRSLYRLTATRAVLKFDKKGRPNSDSFKVVAESESLRDIFDNMPIGYEFTISVGAYEETLRFKTSGRKWKDTSKGWRYKAGKEGIKSISVKYNEETIKISGRKLSLEGTLPTFTVSIESDDFLTTDTVSGVRKKNKIIFKR